MSVVLDTVVIRTHSLQRRSRVVAGMSRRVATLISAFLAALFTTFFTALVAAFFTAFLAAFVTTFIPTFFTAFVTTFVPTFFTAFFTAFLLHRHSCRLLGIRLRLLGIRLWFLDIRLRLLDIRLWFPSRAVVAAFDRHSRLTDDLILLHRLGSISTLFRLRGLRNAQNALHHRSSTVDRQIQVLHARFHRHAHRSPAVHCILVGPVRLFDTVLRVPRLREPIQVVLQRHLRC